MRRAPASMLVTLLLFAGAAASAQPAAIEGTITISGAWAVYPTAVAWGAAFERLHPAVKVDVSAGGAGKGAADAIAGLVDLGMVSREPDPAELARGITPVLILHDAVFPVVSAGNPALPRLLERGVGIATLSAIYVTGTITDWDAVVGDKVGRSIHVYTRSDSCGAAAAWAAPFAKKQEDLRGIGVYGDPGLLQAVVRDPLGLGYANFSYVFTRTGAIVSGAALLPIDADGNGRADPSEVLADRRAAIAAIETGRYPVTRRSYFYVMRAPRPAVREFLRFALSDEGARVVEEVATSLPLTAAQRRSVLAGLE